MLVLSKIQPDNELDILNDEVEEMLALVRRLKAEQYDFITIFHLTGLQPEIIQSL